MSDLIIEEGTVLVVDASAPLLPHYDLFRMEANSSIVTSVDLVISARRASFGTPCSIQARGAPGLEGAIGFAGTDGNSLPSNDATGGPGGMGDPAGNGRNVTIEAGLARAGELTIVTDGGFGGRGGMGGRGGNSDFFRGGDGGPGGSGGRGGNAGAISVTWTPLTGNLRSPTDPAPIGHQYRSQGGQGGNGGIGGHEGVGTMGSGVRGANGSRGEPGTSQEVTIEWRQRTYGSRLWVQKQDMGPKERTGHALTWDPDRHRVVLFGGQVMVDGARRWMGDTWEWDGDLWTQVADTGPSPRGSSMAFDSVTRSVVLFGGGSENDTWLWNGNEWVQVEDSGPSPRFGYALAADEGRSRVVLFGGKEQNVDGTRGDTWEWDGTVWSQAADIGPSARWGTRMAYNLSGGNVVLFGGVDGISQRLGDTWGWNGDTWTQIADIGPGARMSHAMASDGVGVVMFGGQVRDANPQTGDGGRARDTWVFYDERWRQLQDMGPSARSDHSLVYDDEETLILFGGSDNEDSMLGDTWYFAERAVRVAG